MDTVKSKRSDRRREEAVQPTKMMPELIALIDSKLREQWSPEQISGWLLYEQEQLLSHETIYRHIWSNKRDGGEQVMP